jgi:signal transduction histidine kinase
VGNSVILSVADVGRGFSTEHITKVGAYMQFDRKLHEQQGLGLGLTIVRRLTELHGGTLTIQSEKGAGTVVTVKFPKVVASETGAVSDGGVPASHQPA